MLTLEETPAQPRRVSAPDERRRPAGRRQARRWLVVGLVALGLCTLAGWVGLPRLVEARARAWLAAVFGPALRVDRVEWRFPGELRLAGVEAFVWAPGENRIPSPPTVIRVDEVSVPAGLAAWLGGGGVPALVHAGRAVITVGHWPEAASGEGDAIRREARRRWPDGLPEVRIDELVICSPRGPDTGDGGPLKGTDSARVSTSQPLCRLALHAVPARGEPAWLVNWQDRADRTQRGVLRVDLGAATVSAVRGGLPAVSLGWVMSRLPETQGQIERWVHRAGVEGRVRVVDLRLSPEGARVVADLESGLMHLPLGDPAGGRFVDIEGVNGRIRLSGGRVEASLAGRVLGARVDVRASGSVAGSGGEAAPLELELTLAGLDVPRPAERAATLWADLFEQVGLLRFLEERYEFAGAVDVHVRLCREPEGGRWRLAGGHVDLRGVDVVYRRFAYPLRDVRGRISFDQEGIRIERAVGRHTGGTFVVKGRFAEFTPQCALDVVISGADVPLDEALREALWPEHQRLWERFSPAGRADVIVRLHRDPPEGGRAHPIRVAVEAEVLDGAACYAGLPVPVTDIRGRLKIDSRGVQVAGLAGRVAPGGEVRICGDYVPGRETGAPLHLWLAARDVPVAEELVAALPEAARKAVAQYGITGWVDLAARIESTGRGRPPFVVEASLRTEALRMPALPVVLDDVRALLTIRPDSAEIRRLEGRWSGAIARGAGRVPLRGQEPARFSLGVERLDVERASVSLPQRAGEAIRRLGLTGTVAVRLEAGSVSPESGAGLPGQGSVPWRLDIVPVSLSARPEAMPVAVRDLSGRVRVTEEGVRIDGLRGAIAGGHLTLSGCSVGGGVGGWAWEGTARLEGVTLDERIAAALPEEFRSLWRRLRPAGKIDAVWDDVSLAQDAERGVRGRLTGLIRLADVSLDSAVRLEGVRGRLRGRLEVAGQPGHVAIDTDALLDSLIVNGLRLEGLRARLIRAAGSPALEIRDLRAAMGGGEVAGQGRIAAGQSAVGVAMSGRLWNVPVESLLASQDGGHGGRLGGQASGRFFYQRDGETCRAGADLRVTEMAWFRTPPLLAIVDVLRWPPAVRDHRPQATMRLYMDGRRVQVEQLHLEDGQVRLTGRGWVDLPTRRLRLDLLSSMGLEQTQFAVLEELLSGAAREVVAVEVGGTLNRPQVRTRPLRSLDASIRTLLSASPSE